MNSSKFSIEYGIEGSYYDVTSEVLKKCYDGKVITIPSCDHRRAAIVGDHLVGILKHILITKDNIQTRYNHDVNISIELDKDDISLDKTKKYYYVQSNNPMYILSGIHNKLKFVGGSLREEFEEQVMSVMFIEPNMKVLELGSNIGRNTLVIASILNDSKNLVTLESDVNTVEVLKQNKLINNLNFEIEPSALSYRSLVQKGWDTFPSDQIPVGFNKVNTITYQELENKYNIKFDTLVVDCEGALYYILLDYPEMLDNINVVIMENDYRDIKHKKYVDDTLTEKGLERVYKRQGGWGPCYSFFYEVWKRKI